MTPPEINLRGPRALEAQNRALTEGGTLVKKIPIMSIGQDRSGKTGLKKSLQGLRFNPGKLLAHSVLRSAWTETKSTSRLFILLGLMVLIHGIDSRQVIG